MRRPLLYFSVAALIIGLAPLPRAAVRPTTRHVHVFAESYAYSPATISVDRGDRVTLELASTDSTHGLFIEGYGVEAKSTPGQTAQITFVADRAGVFLIRCTVSCGPLHPFMIGRLRVGPGSNLWRVAFLAIVATVLGAQLGSARKSRSPYPAAGKPETA